MDFNSLDIEPHGFITLDSPFDSLKSAIGWSISHNEDVIFCISNREGLIDLDLNKLENVIYDIVPEAIYSIYVLAKYKESIPVNKFCKVIVDIADVSSFILTRPIYQFTLSLIEQRENEFPEMEWSDFVSLIIPHCLSLSCEGSIVNSSQIKIHVISPFRNAMPYIQECLDSIKRQSYSTYHIYFVDDASTDRSVSKIPDEHYITLKINKKRKYALKNILSVLLDNSIADEDIVCIVDSDDKLAHKYVFSILNSLYQNNSLLLTYGSMKFINDFVNIGSAYSIEEFKNIRNYPWRAMALRSFRFKVFKEFMRQDPGFDSLRDQRGKIIKMPYDMALFYPLMELAGYENVKFVPALMYEYRLHESNDQFIHRKEQLKGENEIRLKRRFKRFF